MSALTTGFGGKAAQLQVLRANPVSDIGNILTCQRHRQHLSCL